MDTSTVDYDDHVIRKTCTHAWRRGAAAPRVGRGRRGRGSTGAAGAGGHSRPGSHPRSRGSSVRRTGRRTLLQEETSC